MFLTKRMPTYRASVQRRGPLRTNALLSLLIVCCCTTGTRAQDAPAVRPNIVLIMADDLGVECLGCYGGMSYHTPNLDRLARRGMRFMNAYSMPLCTNTRLQLMTGKYNQRNWIAFGILDPRERTIGHWLTDAGYRSCIAGKWQLQSYDPPEYPGAAKRRGLGMRVENAGFDEYCLWHTGHTELKGSRYADPVILENGQFRDDTQGRYGPDIWVEYINDFIERNRERPFFVYYPMALPHGPMVPTPKSAEWPDTQQRGQSGVRFFRDMVEYTDHCVGRIVEKIDELGLAPQTLIVFYSDNGTHRSVISQTRNGAVTGGKGLTTNAGTHVPLVVRWSGRVESGQVDDLIDSTDILPTLMHAAQAELPADGGFDGKSFYPSLFGDSSSARRWLYCNYDPRPGWDKDKYTRRIFVRDKRFKLYDDGRLYDLAQDLLEKNPIGLAGASDRQTAVRKRLSSVLRLLRP